jgi:hypothetical protein
VTIILLLLIGAACKKEEVSIPDMTLKKNNNSESSTSPAQKDNTVDSGLTVVERGSEKGSDTDAVSSRGGASGFKVLPVTKIISRGNSKVSEEDLIRYMLHSKHGTDSSKGEGLCTSEYNNDSLIAKLHSKRIHFAKSVEDTLSVSKLIFEEVYEKSNFSEVPIVNYYYVTKNGTKTDSLLFFGHGWDCPDYRTLLVDSDNFPFTNLTGFYNYLGNNHGDAATPFGFKPYFWDKYMQKYTSSTPVVPANDSSSLLIYSNSGFDVRYNEIRTLEPTEREKQLILENLLPGITGISCFEEVTIEKLATADGKSRFVGLLQVYGCLCNNWYIADIENDNCVITWIELNDACSNPAFYCSYSFSNNNLPDIYVWALTGDKGNGRGKAIYFKSNDLWIHTITIMEYTDDCFDN